MKRAGRTTEGERKKKGRGGAPRLRQLALRQNNRQHRLTDLKKEKKREKWWRFAAPPNLPMLNIEVNIISNNRVF